MTAIRTIKQSPMILNNSQVKSDGPKEAQKKTVIKDVKAPEVKTNEAEEKEGNIHYLDDEAIPL